MDQPSLNFTPVLDAPRGETLKRDAMARVEAHADPVFKDRALLAVADVAYRQHELISDDVWQALDGCASHDNRALGPVMKHAQKIGLIVPTDAFRLTAQARRHKAPVRVWRSLVLAEQHE